MNVQFIASVAVIAPEPPQSRKLYMGAFRLPLETAEGDDYYHSEDIEGAKSSGRTAQPQTLWQKIVAFFTGNVLCS